MAHSLPEPPAGRRPGSGKAAFEPGEAADSDRIIRTIGPNVMASVYYFYDEVHEKRIDPPPFL